MTEKWSYACYWLSNHHGQVKLTPEHQKSLQLCPRQCLALILIHASSGIHHPVRSHPENLTAWNGLHGSLYE